MRARSVVVLCLLMGSSALASETSPEAQISADIKTCNNSDAESAGFVEACARAIAAGRENGSDLAILHVQHGRGLIARGDRSNGMFALRKAVEIDPQNPWAWRELGWALGDDDEWAETLEVANKAIALERDHDNGYDLRGWALRHLEREEEAIEAFSTALALDPDDWTMRQIGWALRDQGKYEEAEGEIRRAIRADPDDPWNHYALAYVLDDQTHYDAAVAAYDRAIGLDDQTAQFYRWRAHTHWTLGNLAKALADFDQALALDPAYSAAMEQRGWILVDMDDRAAARAAFQATIEMDADWGDPHLGLSFLHAKAGETDQTLAALEAGLALDYDAEKASRVLGVLLNAGRLLTAGKAAYAINKAARAREP